MENPVGTCRIDSSCISEEEDMPESINTISLGKINRKCRGLKKR
jgi:hypothetical protein